MTRNEKLITGLIIGAAAGIAAAFFFDTSKGQEVLSDIKKLTSSAVDDIVSRLGNVETKIKEKLIAVTSDNDDFENEV